jgi:hypothetical protein
MDKDCRILGANKKVLDIVKMNIEEYRGFDYRTLAWAYWLATWIGRKIWKWHKKVIKTGMPLMEAIDPPILDVNGKDLYQITNHISLKDEKDCIKLKMH